MLVAFKNNTNLRRLILKAISQFLLKVTNSWSYNLMFYLHLVSQRLISKPRNMWLLPHQPRLDTRSSCLPSSNLQNISPTPVACSTPPLAARRRLHLKVSQTKRNQINKIKNQTNKQFWSLTQCKYEAWISCTEVNVFLLSGAFNLTLTNGLFGHLFCPCPVLYVFSQRPFSQSKN